MIKSINQAIAKRHEEGEKGFTLIELLVVILIIGVLAAIAIPAFLNQRQGAWEAQVKSDIANAVIAAETFAVSNNGSYAPTSGAMDLADLTANGYNKTTDVNLAVTSATGTDYVLTVTHTQMGATTPNWVFTHSTGKTVKTP